MCAAKKDLSNLEQQGVRKKWATGRKAHADVGRRWIQNYDTCHDIRKYVGEGVPPKQYISPLGDGEVAPPYQAWEKGGIRWLAKYGKMRAFEVEVEGLEKGVFDAPRAHDAFIAMYTYALGDLYKTYLRPARFKTVFSEGRIEDKDGILFSAWGLLFGRREEACTVARLYLRMFRHGFFRNLGDYPVYLFVLRLFADYFGEPVPEVFGRARAYPTYTELLAVWRTPDPQALISLCLAVCDLHTHHGYKQPDGWFGDFGSLEWAYTPVEILVLFKMRQWLGLENPELDHPLMNNVLGKLPEESRHEPSELISGLLAIMKYDGFNEETIIQRIMDDEFGLAQRSNGSA